MYDKFIKEYNDAVYDTNRVRAMQVIDDALADGVSPKSVIFDLIVPAMNRMVKSISTDFDANLAQHFMTAQIASEATEAMIARLESPPEVKGRIVIGTASGDMHTLGKRIVIGCLKALMIESIDLGVNVSPEKFVDEAVSHNAPVIAISAMMAHTATGDSGPLGVRRLLQERGLDSSIKLIVGGAPFRFDSELYKAVEADAVADDGLSAGNEITRLIQEIQS